MRSSDLWIESFFVGALAMRCSVVTDLSSGDTVIIDGGSESSRIISWINEFDGRGPDWSNGPRDFAEMNQHGIAVRRVVALVNTHAHFDHSGEIPLLLDEYDVSWYLHKDDFFLQSLAQKSGMRWGFNLPDPAVADKLLFDEMDLKLGTLNFKILHTPGHTLGGCCIMVDINDGPNHLFAGDTLFAGSVGRTDLPNTGGDFSVLSNSIITKLWPLDEDTVVHPGHGPTTTIGVEKTTNPYVGSNSPAFGKYH